MDTSTAITQVRILNKGSNDITDQYWSRFAADKGIPSDIATRVQGLLTVTRKVGDHVINIGRILIDRIIEFIKSNPNMAIGIALGAAIGALINTIPFIGPLLSPIAMSIGAFIGGAFGAYLDKKAKGGVASNDALGGVLEGAIEAAKQFLALIIDIFRALKAYLNN